MLDSLFSRFTITFWIRWIAVSSLAIFLTVIGLNYSSIGAVQEMNRALQEGPLDARGRWLSIALRFAQMEAIRMAFLAHPSAETAAKVEPIQESMAVDLAALGGAATDEVRREARNYSQAYAQIVEAVDEKVRLNQLLVKDREEVETQVYELDNKTMEEVLVEFQLAELGYMARQTAERVNSIRVILDRMARDVSAHPKAVPVLAAVTGYRKRFEEIVAKDQRVTERTGWMSLTAEKVTRLVTERVAEADRQAEAAARMARDKAASAQRIALVWTVVGTVVAMVLSFLFDRVFKERIRLTLEGFSVLSQGDLRFRFAGTGQSSNELYRINAAANRMADTLSALLTTITTRVNALNSMIDILNATQHALQKKSHDGLERIGAIHVRNEAVEDSSRKVDDHARATLGQAEESRDGAFLVLNHINTIAAASEEASSNVSTMAAAAEEMTANLAGVNTSLADTTRSVADVAREIRQLDQSLDQVRQRCEMAAHEAGRSMENVEKAREIIQVLTDANQEIGSVVELINNIADQTNMLALNASIEAAGAGEVGRGFAVVANEVKELAKQTSNATLTITDRIMEMQSQARDARTVMVDVVASIVKVNDMNAQITLTVNEQSQTTRRISSSVGDVAQGAEAVSVNAQELNLAANEIARAAGEAAAGTSEIARVAADTSTQTRLLHGSAETTRDQSQQVSGMTREIFTASDEVRNLGLRMMEEMNELQVVTDTISAMVDKLHEVASELHQATTVFRVVG
ncbi:MAG: hypothetical protein HQL76_03255 [Magnetococcales bacterium]|nr:hypothetical protein [Magnetococcales bacterium]